MSLDYTALFTDLGTLVKQYDAFGTTAAGLDAAAQTILDAFQSDNQDVAADGLAGTFKGWKKEYQSRRSSLAKYATKRLQDRDSVLSQVGAISTDIGEVLAKLILQMQVDNQTVERSVATIGGITAAGTNQGNGTILTTRILDGVSSPGALSGVSFAANGRYKGLNSELTSPSETMRLTCIADSFQDQQTEGAETFLWEGGVPISQHGVDSEGSGQIGSLQALHANALLSNLDFETFTGTNTPSSWTINTGTAGTHILAETTTIYHGLKSLKLLGDGSLAAINLSQAPSRSLLTANKAYCFTCRLKADASIAAGDLTIQFEGTGYTAGSTEKISIAHGSLPTSWSLQSFFVNLPANIPSDFKLVVKWTGTPTNAKAIYLDDLAFGPVVYGGGIGVAAVRGNTPFQRNDWFSFPVSSVEGVFQRFFRRAYGVMLPSLDSPTIGDALAS